jgi:hypothetical protein
MTSSVSKTLDRRHDDCHCYALPASSYSMQTSKSVDAQHTQTHSNSRKGHT